MAVNVTRTYLPPLDEYVRYLEGIWARGQITNHGPLVLELEEKLRAYLGVKHLFFVANGTIALQIALKALDLRGDIVTTPFSYVATTSSIVWENCLPVFADIEPRTLSLDPEAAESAITPATSAILATHVFGNPCDVERLADLAGRRRLSLIYDAAHAFGVRYGDRSILRYGDISTLSFHATKLFHTVEGGAIVTERDDLAHRISYMRNFGHDGAEKFWGLGINGKNCELHAAMGLCLLPRIDRFIEERREIAGWYDDSLASIDVERPVIRPGTAWNFSYYPVFFRDEAVLLKVREALNSANIFPRRYFYPALNRLPYVAAKQCPEAEGVASRIMCLPMFNGMDRSIVDLVVRRIATVI